MTLRSVEIVLRLFGFNIRAVRFFSGINSIFLSTGQRGPCARSVLPKSARESSPKTDAIAGVGAWSLKTGSGSRKQSLAVPPELLFGALTTSLIAAFAKPSHRLLSPVSSGFRFGHQSRSSSARNAGSIVAACHTSNLDDELAPKHSRPRAPLVSEHKRGAVALPVELFRNGWMRRYDYERNHVRPGGHDPVADGSQVQAAVSRVS